MQEFKSGTWYDIETAPKDGTLVLLETKWGVLQGFWHQPGNPAKAGFWMCYRHSSSCPTRWMPLPQPSQKGGANAS